MTRDYIDARLRDLAKGNTGRQIAWARAFLMSTPEMARMLLQWLRSEPRGEHGGQRCNACSGEFVMEVTP